MNWSSLVQWASAVADLVVVGGLMFGLYVTRASKRKWWPVLLALLVVALAFPYLTTGAPGGAPVGVTASLVQLAIAGALLLVALVMRSEVLAPGRLLRSMSADLSLRDRYADSVEAIVMTTTPGGTIVHINRYGQRTLGVHSSELIGRNWLQQLADTHVADKVRSEFRRFTASRGRSDMISEYPVMTAAGPRTICWRRSAILSESGDVVGIISHGTDVTAERRMEATLRFESHLLDSVHDLVTVVGLDGELLYFNRAAHEVCGFTEEEYRRLGPLGWVAFECVGTASDGMATATLEGAERYEIDLLCADGECRPFEIHSHSLEYEGRPAVMNVARDITSRREQHELLSKIAFNDPLTGLANRRLLVDRLSMAFARARRTGDLVALLYLDVDNLKMINDTIGHDAGDQMIIAVAERLTLALRVEDTLARVGGDEFVAVLCDITSRDDALTVIDRLNETLRAPLEVGGRSFPMSASIGLYFADDDVSEAEALQRADRAMYVAKKSGGNGYRVYSPEMDSAISARYQLQHDVCDALDAHAIRLHYQPIISPRTRVLAGTEALLRWTHPEHGPIAPDQLLAAASAAGLLGRLGEYVLREACMQMADWRRSGLVVPRIAVNLTAEQIADQGLIERVEQVLAETGLDPECLELEITETAAMDGLEMVEGVLRHLCGMGVRIALDDFGTGHSSLERLQRLPITTLKIDKSFIDEVTSADVRQPIVDTIVVLASNLGLSVVAEGVEDEDQLCYLEAFGNVQIQGFIFGRACDPVSFRRFATGRPIATSPVPIAPGLREASEQPHNQDVA